MAQKLPRKDVAIIGLGWTGSILAHELTEEGLDDGFPDHLRPGRVALSHST
jgi:glycine/D-amino acid oxidase-like deaminating enzyme